MTAKLKTPLCGQTFPDGQCIDGWVCDEATGLPVRRCPCRFTDPSGHALMHDGQRAAAAANPGQSEAAKKIIRDAAYVYREFSANELLAAFKHAGIDSQGVAGNAFTAVAAEGLIFNTGRQVWSKKGTTRSQVYVWQSNAFGTEKPAGTGAA